MSHSTNQTDPTKNILSSRAFSSVFPSLAAGALAGAIAKTTIAPLDRTKINFQVSKTRQYSFKSAFHFAHRVYKTDGFFALYRGNSATMIRVVPYAAIQFASHEEYKHFLQVDRNGKRTPFKRYLSGSLAAVTATLLTYPLDTAKARLAASSANEIRNLLTLFSMEYQQHGFFTFWRGITPTMLGVIPYAGFSFFTYETCKLLYADSGSKITPIYTLLFGAFASLIGQSTSYPLDIVRRRMQTHKIPIGQSVLKSLNEIWRYEGMKGLYKGLSMNWIKGPIAVGISFTTYDYLFAYAKRMMSMSLK